MSIEVVRPFVGERVALVVSDAKLQVIRSGWQCILSETKGDRTLAFAVAGQLPYFYRAPEKIGLDFAARHHALQMVIDMAAKAPKSPVTVHGVGIRLRGKQAEHEPT